MPLKSECFSFVAMHVVKLGNLRWLCHYSACMPFICSISAIKASPAPHSTLAIWTGRWRRRHELLRIKALQHISGSSDVVWGAPPSIALMHRFVTLATKAGNKPARWEGNLLVATLS